MKSNYMNLTKTCLASELWIAPLNVDYGLVMAGCEDRLIYNEFLKNAIKITIIISCGGL